MILLSPFAQKMRNGLHNPKSPTPEWWATILKGLNTPVVQIGVAGEPVLVPDFRVNLSLARIAELVRECETWISPDSFLPHLAHHAGVPGIVIWSRSDPEIFGYKENYNILKSRDHLRKNTFGMWEEESYIAEAFPDIAEVIYAIKVVTDAARLKMV